MNKQDLLPCPFCRCSSIRIRKDVGVPQMGACYFVNCRGENCGGEVGGFYTEAQAIEAWNRRAPLQADHLDAERQWRPIETLPKEFKDEVNGGEFLDFLTCANYTDEPRMVQMQYWHFVKSCEEGLYTHWMPLPVPPAIAAAKNGRDEG